MTTETTTQIARSFRDAEARGFKVYPRTALANRLAVQREIEQRFNAERQQANTNRYRLQARTLQRLENRNRLFAIRQAELLREPGRERQRYVRSMIAIGAAVEATATMRPAD